MSDASREIGGALRRALPILFTARVIGLATLPLVGALVLWTVVGVLAWNPVQDAIAHVLGAGDGDVSEWRRVAAATVAVLMFAALAIATGLAAIALLTMPVIVRTVAARHFPRLDARHGGTLSASTGNAIVALLVFVPLWLLSLPLLVLPPLYVAASLLLNAWLSQRMFRYDALAEHATADEIAGVVRERRHRLFALGLVLSPLSLVPLVNVLVLPIYAAIAFTELCLAELSRRRTAAAAQAAA